METLDTTIRHVLTAQLATMHFSMPGIIQTYDAAKKTVSVLPSIKTEFADGSIKSMPIISKVPVVFPGTAEAVFQFPLKKGDGCLIIVSSSSLEKWINDSSGGETEAGDVRRFDLSDAFCIPGLFQPGKLGKVGSNVGMEMLYKNLKVVLNDNGDLELNGAARKIMTDTFQSIFDPMWAALLAAIATGLGATLGPGAAAAASAFTTTATAIPTNFASALTTKVKTE